MSKSRAGTGDRVTASATARMGEGSLAGLGFGGLGFRGLGFIGVRV